ncbi:hypothetical protein ACHAXS_014030 [Conticribra weissflogii]
MKSIQSEDNGDDDDNHYDYQPTINFPSLASGERASPSLTPSKKSGRSKSATTKSPLDEIPILPLCSEALLSASAELELCRGDGGGGFDDGSNGVCERPSLNFDMKDGGPTNQTTLPFKLAPFSHNTLRNSRESFDSPDANDKQPLQSPTSEKNFAQTASIDNTNNVSSSTDYSDNIIATPISNQSRQKVTEIQTPSPYLPKSIASYIQTAEKELQDSKAGQLHIKNIITSPRTPTIPYKYGTHDIQSPNINQSNTPNSKNNNYMTTSLATYIQSAEKEFDDIVKDTLTSPVRSFPKINDVVSPMNSPQIIAFAAVEASLREGSRKDELLVEEISLQSANLLGSPPSLVEQNADKTAGEEFSTVTNNVNDNSTASEGNKELDEEANQPTNQSSRCCPPSSFWVICKRICCLNLVAALMLLSSGSLTYPAHPLLYPASTFHPCHHRCNEPPSTYQKLQASEAAVAFSCATTLRTTISAPLIRLKDKLQWTLMDRPVRFFDAVASFLERMAHHIWEDVARQRGALRNNHDGERKYESSTVFRRPLELDLGLVVPCDNELLREFLLNEMDASRITSQLLLEDSDSNSNTAGYCTLRDVITHDLLIDYFKIHHDAKATFDLATQPIVLRNVWDSEFLLGNDVCTSSSERSKIVDKRKKSCSIQYHRRLSINSLMADPQLSHFPLPNHFSDASTTGYSALVPDATTPITISQFIKNILSGITPNAKIGTQVIVEEFPELRNEIMPLHLAEELFWWNPWWEDAKSKAKAMLGPSMGRLMDKLPAMSYYPIFIGSTRTPGTSYPRTDLHCEPIGNQAVQLQGTRRWTLIPASASGVLRPTVSKHGRGYFYSNLDPFTELPNRLKSLPVVYEVVTSSGDAVWIPPWVWHRVDYFVDEEIMNEDDSPKDSLSLGASIFHFYPGLFASNFPLFALLIVPNLIWEALGLNIE